MGFLSSSKNHFGQFLNQTLKFFPCFRFQNLCCNSSFILPFPKVNDLLSHGGYCQTNLIGGIYKVIPKVLANRLKMIIGSMVGEV